MATSTQNLYELLVHAAQHHPSNGVLVYEPGRTASPPVFQPYQALLAEAQVLGAIIQSIPDTNSETIVLIHLDNHLDNIKWLLATIAAGRIPAMSTPCTSDLSQRRKHLSHLQQVLNDPIILTSESLVAEFLDLDLTFYTIEDMATQSVPLGPKALSLVGQSKASTDIAALMLTSGSTGHAKAVTLRHGQVLQAVRGKALYHGTAGRHDAVLLNWIGMDHVANLTEIMLHAMSIGATQVHAQAADVIADPLLFLRLVDKHRVVYSFAPNFFLAKIQKALEAAPNKEFFDLSTLTALISGGEANSTSLCSDLTDSLVRFGVKPGFIRPGFGMTETCAGSIYNLECPAIDQKFSREYTSLGHCIPGMEMRVTRADGSVCEKGEVGQLEVRGSNVFDSYFNNPKATADSFREGGWFITGDLAFLDSDKGRLNMVGREKELLNLNGVKYYPHELEGAIEDAKIPGVVPSFTAVFSHRLPGAASETFNVVYLPAYEKDDVAARASTRAELRTTAMRYCMARPHKIIPLERGLFAKSALGKLSRAKIRTAFQTGVYDACIAEDEHFLAQINEGTRIEPRTELEKIVHAVFCDVFEMEPSEIDATSNLFDLGCSSLEMFQVKNQLQSQAGVADTIPVTMMMTNPTVESLARALEPVDAKRSATPKPYDPVVCLRSGPSGGTQPPLWLVHPGVGEVLVFLHLASLINDRPVYALRARGFDGEPVFGSIEELLKTYRDAIQARQPAGPYSICGYSYGGTMAFEITKSLQRDGFEVPFLGLFDQQPQIMKRMRHSCWTNVLMFLSDYFDLLGKDAHGTMTTRLEGITWPEDEEKDEIIDDLLKLASRERVLELGLDKARLRTWSGVALNSHRIARDYEPSGFVPWLEVFYGHPSEFEAPTREIWRNEKLSGWQEFAEHVEYHDMPGTHNTILAAENVSTFYKTLMARLTARGF